MNAFQHVWHYWASGGVLLWPLAVVSFFILFFVIRTQLTARRLLLDGRQLRLWLMREGYEMDAKKLQETLPHNSFSSVFHTAFAHMQVDGMSPLAAIALQENDAMQFLRRDLLLLTALTASAPLLGLLGTVGGMIATFDAVAHVTGQTGTRVAGGISRALITTQFGLVVAMPGVFGLAHIRQVTRDVQLLLGDCRAHIVAMLAVGSHAVGKGVQA